MAFHGGFRIHEVLARTAGEFDPEFTLLGRDAKIQHCKVEGRATKCIEVRVKNPKESRARTVAVIDVLKQAATLAQSKHLRNGPGYRVGQQRNHFSLMRMASR